MLPSNTGKGFTIKGPVGIAPDISIRDGIIEPCKRSKLPLNINQLKFVLHGNYAQYHILKNFYFFDSFFIVNSKIKNFLINYSGAFFEIRQIYCIHLDETPLNEEYWAMKVTTRLPCLDPNLSTVDDPLSGWPRKKVQFSKRLLEYELDECLVKEYSNFENNKYRSYPSVGVEQVILRWDLIPDGINMFEIEFWPGNIIIDPKFAKELNKRCQGGTLGYYFWTVDLDDVSKNHHELQTSLR
jgi:hypothetical protein